jgi:hypothetical protein
MRWASESLDFGGERTLAAVEGRVRQALDRCWPSAVRAISTDTIAVAADIIQDDIVPIYLDLFQLGLERDRRESPEAPDDLDDAPWPEDEETEGFITDPDDLQDLIRGSPIDDSPAESWILLSDDGEAAPEPDDDVCSKRR